MPPRRRPSCRPFAVDDARDSYATQLHTYGVTVIPCLDEDTLAAQRAHFDAAAASFPEFKPNATGLVMGGFSALGNPASFHNPFVRRVRQWCMHAAVEELWADYVAAYKPGAKLEQCIDRMMLRPAGVAPSAESWHRDEALHSGADDETFGGWLNLDDRPQYFNCVPGTHAARPNQHGGFARITSKAEQEHYAETCSAVEVPPGHLLVFVEHIVHEVRSVKATYPMYRVFIGWRVTDDANPLTPPTAHGLRTMLEDQAVMSLKSGQTPPMYALLHWTNWVSKIEAFTEANIVDACKELRRVESGRNAGVSYLVVHRYMRSLREYGMPLYPAYKPHEVNMHIPRRRWKVLLPGRSRLYQTVTL